MKVRYNKKADPAFTELLSKKPDGAVEMAEGVILHKTPKNEFVAVEIFGAAKKIRIRSFYKLVVIPATV